MKVPNLIQKALARAKHKLKRFGQRIVIKSHHKLELDNSRPVSPYEMEAFKMCKYFIKREDSELTMSTDGSKYIFNKNEKIDIFIKQNFVEIIVDAKYPYDVILSDRMYKRITLIFNNNVDARRKSREVAVISGVKYSLSGVLNDITEKNPK